MLQQPQFRCAGNRKGLSLGTFLVRNPGQGEKGPSVSPSHPLQKSFKPKWAYLEKSWYEIMIACSATSFQASKILSSENEELDFLK